MFIIYSRRLTTAEINLMACDFVVMQGAHTSNLLEKAGAKLGV